MTFTYCKYLFWKRCRMVLFKWEALGFRICFEQINRDITYASLVIVIWIKMKWFVLFWVSQRAYLPEPVCIEPFVLFVNALVIEIAALVTMHLVIANTYSTKILRILNNQLSFLNNEIIIFWYLPTFKVYIIHIL